MYFAVMVIHLAYSAVSCPLVPLCDLVKPGRLQALEQADSTRRNPSWLLILISANELTCSAQSTS